MLGLAPLSKQALGKLEIDNLRKLVLGPLNTSLEVLSPRNVNSLCWFKSALFFMYLLLQNRLSAHCSSGQRGDTRPLAGTRSGVGRARGLDCAVGVVGCEGKGMVPGWQGCAGRAVQGSYLAQGRPRWHVPSRSRALPMQLPRL